MSTERRINPDNTPVADSVRDIFYMSFHHSQGNSKLQIDMFNWFFVNGVINRDAFNQLPPSNILEISVPNHHVPVSDEGRKIATPTDMWDLAARMARIGNPDPTLCEQRILDGIIRQDTHFQFLNAPRAAYDGIGEPDSRYDKRASFLRKHVVSGVSSGNVGFDLLYDGIKKRLYEVLTQNLNTGTGTKKRLSRLVKKWERNHPGYKFFGENHSHSIVAGGFVEMS